MKTEELLLPSSQRRALPDEWGSSVSLSVLRHERLTSRCLSGTGGSEAGRVGAGVLTAGRGGSSAQAAGQLIASLKCFVAPGKLRRSSPTLFLLSLCRSNGFEQQRLARIANKKAVQELAYKWSVEDM